MSANQTHGRLVGMDLQGSEESEAIVSAIVALHPDAAIRRSPGLLRVESPGRMEIRRELVEERLRREWDTQELNLSMVTFFGEIEEWDEDRIIIAWRHLT